MKRRLRQILSLALLALLLASAVAPALSPAVAEEDFLIENGVLVRYLGEGSNVKIPNGVTEIGAGAFLGKDGVTSVTIPKGVWKIGSSAFWLCSGLKTVTIPKGVTEIGDSAFQLCVNLKTVTLPDSVTTIGAWAFRSCTSLTRIAIPKRVTAIGQGTFVECTRLARVTLPKGLKTISLWAFNSCLSLADINIPSTVTQIGEEAFLSCVSLKKVVIPGGVEEIGAGAFRTCRSLAQVKMGYGVKTIGNRAFAGCASLSTVAFPNSLQTIGPYAFRDCVALTGIVLPDSVETIGANAFAGCPYLRVVAAPKGISEEDVQSAAPDAAPEILRLPDDLLPPALFLRVGQTMVLPKFKGAKVAWSVQGEPIVTIGKGNKLKGVQAGEAVLRLNVLAAVQGKALTLNGEPLNPDKTYDIPLKVFKKTDAVVKKVSVSAKSVLMHPTGYGYPAVKQIYFAFTPVSLTGNADWKGNCLFVSSNPNVAQVNQEGKIFAIKPGKATITVYAPNLKTAKVSVTVKGLITSLKLKDEEDNYVKKMTLFGGDASLLRPEFNADAAFTALRWSSSNPAVVEVHQSGTIYADSKGTAKITATAMDGSGKKATVIVTVMPPP
ncbi:MAG: leucine-rich repeat protein [Christensenellales bacterium]